MFIVFWKFLEVFSPKVWIHPPFYDTLDLSNIPVRCMHMKKLSFIVVLFFLIISCSTTLYAHPGGTDSNGGHYNRSTGEYHYHHGYSAHQHPGGVCPYDAGSNDSDDSKSNSISSNVSKQENSISKNSSSNSSNVPDISFYEDFSTGMVILVFVITTICLCVIARLYKLLEKQGLKYNKIESALETARTDNQKLLTEIHDLKEINNTLSREYHDLERKYMGLYSDYDIAAEKLSILTRRYDYLSMQTLQRITGKKGMLHLFEP